MLRDLCNTQGGNNSSSPEVNIFGYKCNCVEIAGDTYLLNTTLFWVLKVFT